MYQYKAYGLRIHSEIIIEELLQEESEDADITIILGKVPEQFMGLSVDTPSIKINHREYYSDISKVAKFHVYEGRIVTVEPYTDADKAIIILYLLGSCMGAALYQRRILPLHGSCVYRNKKGVLLTGESGAGKSTVAAALCRQDSSFLADDISALRISGASALMVCPGYPRMKLWEDAMLRMDLRNEKKSLNRIAEEYEKYSMNATGSFIDEPKPLAVIIELIMADIDRISLEEIKGAQKLELILRNMYHRLIAEAMDLRKWYFSQCINVASQVAIYRIARPYYKGTEMEIARLIQDIT